MPILRNRANPDCLVGVRVVTSGKLNVLVGVDGWRVDWRVSRRKTTSLRYYLPPSPSRLPPEKTHLMRRREQTTGAVKWSFTVKEARTAVRTGQAKRLLPPPPQPSRALVVAPAARFASLQCLFPGLKGVERMPRHIGGS